MIHGSASKAAQTFQRILASFSRCRRQMNNQITIDLDVFTPSGTRAVILSTEAK